MEGRNCAFIIEWSHVSGAQRNDEDKKKSDKHSPKSKFTFSINTRKKGVRYYDCDCENMEIIFTRKMCRIVLFSSAKERKQ